MTPIENYNRVLRRNRPAYVPVDGISVGAAYHGAWPGQSRPAPGVLEWRDEWNVGWKDADGEVFPVLPSVPSCEDVGLIIPPDPRRAGRFDEIRAIAARLDRGTRVLSLGHPYFLYEKAINIFGPEEFLVSLIGAPDKANRLLDTIIGFELGIADEYVKFKPEHVNLSDDYGHQDRLAMSPAHWREYIKPRIKRVIDFYRARLGPGTVVSFHSCGHVMPILEDFAELGVDILHPVQSRANDMKELRRITSGTITLAGGIDGQQVLPHGTPGDVRREVFEKLDLLWEGGGYLPMPEKTLGVPQENIDAMNQAIRDWSARNVGMVPEET
ncbi:hypothetical protein GX586_13020 [bacterium]|nr:hypothetical protein [bacterium]